MKTLINILFYHRYYPRMSSYVCEFFPLSVPFHSNNKNKLFHILIKFIIHKYNL